VSVKLTRDFFYVILNWFMIRGVTRPFFA